MTVNELYKSTLPLIFENPNSIEYDSYLFPYLNLLLQQNFDINNSIRLHKDLAVLTTAQRVSSKNDILTYEIEMTAEVLQYGLAALLIKEDDMLTTNGKIYNDYMNLYISAQNRVKKAIPTDIEDVYSVEEDN